MPPDTAAPLPGPPVRWQTARVLAVIDETRRVKTFRLALPHRTRHMAGQYFVLRLTAPDGYTASRAYSLSSPPEGPDGSDVIDLTVELLDDGEVSTYLHEVVAPGDELEVRGPIGAFFAWDGTSPALLVAGGSGIVPLMAMLRLARRSAESSAPSRRGNRADLVRLLVSVRTPDDLYFAAELPGPEVTVAWTRTAPPGTARRVGRLGPADVAPLVRGGETVFVCGSAGFADAVTDLLVAAGVPTGSIRVERFGPSG